MPKNFRNIEEPAVPLTGRERSRLEFARNLQRAMDARGWSQSDLARAATLHMADGSTVGRDAISGYVRGLVLPRGPKLNALAAALHMDVKDLMPGESTPSATRAIAPPIDVQDAGGGDAWVRINQRLPWETAIEIMKLVNAARRPADDSE